MLKSTDIDLVKDLLLRLADATAEERAAALDRELAGRPEVRQEVEELLVAGDRMKAGPSGGRSGRQSTPLRIGPYVIESLLGRGGMSCVYRARQTDPITRTVALKVMKPGSDPTVVLARFGLERQAMARLSHQNIARVFDASADADGNPYFVMEMVDGPNLLEFCTQRRLDLRERLELVVRVCRGVQHAHDRGLIHRDLKPSNVLVAFEDGLAIPKVIDFGVSRWLAPAWDLRQTIAGQIIGTPHYMSPEQARGEPDIDVRADVFSIGVMLYELLTGRLPHPDEVYRPEHLTELASNLGRSTPAPPSGTPDPTLSRGFMSRTRSNGEIDCIVLKAISSDRDTRYAGVGQLADDIERYLRGDAVVAKPPTRSYLTRKFLKRHRLAVATAATLATVLVAGIAGVSLSLRHALREQSRAVAALESSERANRESDRARLDAEAAKGRAEAALAQAERSRADAEEVSRFIWRIHALGRPEMLGQDVKLKDATIRLAQLFLTRPPESPMVRARVALALAEPQLHYNQFELGERLLKICLEAADVEGASLPDAVRFQAYSSLGRLRLQRRDPVTARNWFEKARSLAGSSLGPNDVLLAEMYLADVLQLEADYVGANRRREAAVADAISRGVDPRARAWAEAAVVRGYLTLGLYEDVIRSAERLLAERRAEPKARDPVIVSLLTDIANAYLRTGRTDRAVALLEESVPESERVMGPKSEAAFSARTTLILARARRGDPGMPELMKSEAKAAAEAGLPPPVVASWQAREVEVLLLAGRQDEARAAAEQTLRWLREKRFEKTQRLTFVMACAEQFILHRRSDWARELLAEIAPALAEEPADKRLSAIARDLARRAAEVP